MASRKNEPETSRGVPLYPLLLSAYPPLALLVANLGQVALTAGIRSFIFSLVTGALVYGGLRLALRSWRRAAPPAALLLALFFSYGHVYGLLEPLQVGGLAIGRHRYLAPLWLALGGLAFWRLLLRRSYPDGLHSVLNAGAAALVALVLGQLIYAQVQSTLRLSRRAETQSTQPGVDREQANLPDIYWIILDGYARQDALLEDFGFDNRPFLNELREMGFVIPECTQSNYTFTAMSVSSALHMNYIENFTPLVAEGDTFTDMLTYKEYIAHSPVRSFLESMGYQLVTFETGYYWADISDSDYYIVGNDNPLGQEAGAFQISDFEELYLRATALRPLEEISQSLRKKLAPKVLTKFERRYQTVNFMLDQLRRVPELGGPKFVIAHIMAPHDPFVFDANGGYVEITSPQEGYAGQTQYVNRRILEILRTILAQSAVPPVIVIQGDHGWTMPNRNKNLNAYYLPGHAGAVYSTITPVNTFRLIFNAYFDANLPLLDDKSFYSEVDSMYEFTPVASSCDTTP